MRLSGADDIDGAFSLSRENADVCKNRPAAFRMLDTTFRTDVVSRPRYAMDCCVGLARFAAGVNGRLSVGTVLQ